MIFIIVVINVCHFNIYIEVSSVLCLRSFIKVMKLQLQEKQFFHIGRPAAAGDDWEVSDKNSCLGCSLETCDC